MYVYLVWERPDPTSSNISLVGVYRSVVAAERAVEEYKDYDAFYTMSKVRE